jgi:hypothetical protein
VGRRSEIGPGKPYWNNPFGSTGATDGIGEVLGRGIGAEDDRVVGDGGVDLRVGVGLGVDRDEEKITAVRAAPAAALDAAIIARVALAILLK